MDDLTCSECDAEFEGGKPFGDDVQCPKCGVWLETDMEVSCSGDGDESLYFWVVGRAETQHQKKEA